MTCYPSLFVSHGSPTLSVEDCPASRYLKWLGPRIRETLGTPKVILVVSAHHDGSGRFEITTTSKPTTIHDFGGFPQALYQLQYTPPGAPNFAETLAARLRARGFDIQEDGRRGLDHGAWVPLSLMFPEADIPTVQLSIDMRASPESHHVLGKALSDFAQSDVLVIGSGSATHNLREFFSGSFSIDSPPPDWVHGFSTWLAERIEAEDDASVLTAVKSGPDGRRNHPSLDHILPLFTALGAGGKGAKGLRIHDSYTYGVLAMDVYGFGEEDVLQMLTDPVRYRNRAKPITDVVLLHGVGASPDSLKPLAQAIASRRDDLRVHLVPGPDVSSMGGREWFSISGVTETNRPARIADALPKFRNALEGFVGREDLKTTIFIGFSQGAIMALEYAREGGPAGSIISIAGRLGNYDVPVSSVSELALTLIHGNLDRIIPVDHVALVSRAFQQAGAQLETHIVNGLGHRIDGSVAMHVLAAVDAVAGEPAILEGGH